MPSDPLVIRLQDAVAEYERQSGVALSSSSLDSVSAILELVEHRKADFLAFREDGRRMRDKVKPVAKVVQSLCPILGEAFTMPFSPVKAIFAAIGVAVEASTRVKEDYDSIVDAFDTMEVHLRIITPMPIDHHAALREPSVKLLEQMLVILGLVMRLRRDGRLKRWLQHIRQSDEVASALADLGRLAMNHHEAVAAVTLSVAQQTLTILSDSIHWNAQNMVPIFLRRIALQTQEIYNEMRSYASTCQQQLVANRELLEEFRKRLVDVGEETRIKNRAHDIDKIFDWLAYPDSSGVMNALLGARVSGTGSWVLDSRSFASFMSGDKHAIWLHGSAGCGKSTMMSAAILELQAFCVISSSPSIILSHLFDATDSSRSGKLGELLASLLCQVAYHTTEGLSALLKLHERQMHGHSKPSPDVMQHELMSILARVAMRTRIFIAVDALDESYSSDLISLSLRRMLQVHGQISLMVSSRTEAPIHQSLHRSCDIEFHMHRNLVNKDIVTVLDKALAPCGALSHVAALEMQRVRKALCVGADGNFRWTALQIREIAKDAGVPVRLRMKLRRMPRTLRGIYEDLFKSMTDDEKEVIRPLLAWLMFSRGPLSKDVVAELLAFDHELSTPKFDRSLRPSSSQQVLSMLSSTLVSYSGDYIRIAHASVRDYLLDRLSSGCVDEQQANLLMARMCMSYLTEVGFAQRPVRLWTKFPLHFHAGRYWSSYADKALERYPEHRSEIVDFLAKIPYRDGRILCDSMMAERHLNVLMVLSETRVDIYNDLTRRASHVYIRGVQPNKNSFSEAETLKSKGITWTYTSKPKGQQVMWTCTVYVRGKRFCIESSDDMVTARGHAVAHALSALRKERRNNCIGQSG
ncbi:uncharacterized protein SCHCODRAFT_02644444 [Schizophyllum commune H4-8]|uniref:uncharacterized protein n=1 Tax=Schizophyllum commune (strain H4-8 / FGSC 9210) TaxID=578458 RepID=UPI0021600D57|nr:uncharacterized protein SCHCODRAFT_02644444 [Schizophyllum commune H4-8]KAI5885327.1 hypothetical protein SCHCODRAFT_02644444 [Schizophyllum commune H4-8]